MPDRMAETEPAEVYVIHLLRRLPSRVNLAGTVPLRFMPRSLAAIHTRFVQSLHKMTCKESGWKSTDVKPLSLTEMDPGVLTETDPPERAGFFPSSGIGGLRDVESR